MSAPNEEQGDLKAAPGTLFRESSALELLFGEVIQSCDQPDQMMSAIGQAFSVIGPSVS